MKCNKAQTLYFASRDGLLDETERLRLAEHLGRCPECALFVKEMEASLGLMRELPELSPAEGFEWNVKRRIHEERNRLMRREGIAIFGERRWVPRFAIGAAAAAAAVVIAAVVTVGRLGAPEPSVRGVVRGDRAETPALPTPGLEQGSYYDYGPAGAGTGFRMVSDNIFSVGRGSESLDQSPFRFVASSREDSLLRENELLRRRIEGLERQVLVLKEMLERERMQRFNSSLP